MITKLILWLLGERKIRPTSQQLPIPRVWTLDDYVEHSMPHVLRAAEAALREEA